MDFANVDPLTLLSAAAAYGVAKAELQFLKARVARFEKLFEKLFERIEKLERRADVEEATRDLTRRRDG